MPALSDAVRLVTDPNVQPLLASSEAMVSQGARQALAAATVATSAELTAMRSTLQVLSSHLDALQAGQSLPPGTGIASACLGTPANVTTM